VYVPQQDVKHPAREAFYEVPPLVTLDSSPTFFDTLAGYIVRAGMFDRWQAHVQEQFAREQAWPVVASFLRRDTPTSSPASCHVTPG
jgi:hypothetical protein